MTATGRSRAEVTRLVADVDPWGLAAPGIDVEKEYDAHAGALLMWSGPVTAWWVREIFGAQLYPAVVDRLVDEVERIRDELGAAEAP